MESYIGRLLDNRYEILEVIGTGGMAVVYKALDHRLNRMVAIKILKDDLSRSQEFRRRFHTESQAVAMVSHPNIVGVYDVSRTSAVDYIVMELIEGITLKQYLERKGNLNWRETLHFAIQIGKALEHAHSKGIVHRDIKPHNIMILKDGSIKVADFGIARVGSAQNTLTREALGSVHYISPEQAKGAHVDNRSDLYSLGVVMYEMLTGRTPYDGETPVAVAIQHINGGARCPSELVTGIPVGLEQITMHAMNSNVDMRYSSATEMLRDMEEFRKNPAMTFLFGSAAVAAASAPARPVPPVTRPPVTPPRTDAERFAAARNAKAEKRNAEDRRAERALREAKLAEEKRRKTLTVAIAAVAVLFVILVVVLVFVVTGNNSDEPTESTTQSESETVIVDDFVGMRLDEIDPLDYPHLDVDVDDVEESYSDKYDAGIVIRQEPKAGDEVVRDRPVKLTVSKGKDERTMPDFVDQLEATAMQELDRLQLGLNIITEEVGSEEITKGYVVRTDPVAGELLSKNQNVTLYISMGSNKMPDLTGESQEDAKTRLDMMELNLGVSIIEKPHESIPKGYVISTDPVANTKLEKGQKIAVYVSLGSDKMPDLTGETENNAKVALEAMDMGLRINTDFEEASETVPEGHVCRTDPPAGTTLQKGQLVKVYISTGSNKTKVPDVIGKTPEEARAALEAAGLHWVLGDPSYYEGIEPGLVGGMSVAPETEVEKGSLVTIYLCEEPEEVPPPPTETTAAPTENQEPEPSSEGGGQ